jgi:hypothetical protein
LELVSSRSLESWAKAATVSFHPALRALAAILPAGLLLLAAMAARGMLGVYWYLPLCAVLLLEAGLWYFFLRRSKEVADDISWPGYELSLLAPLLALMESASFESRLLRSLCERLNAQGVRPSRQLRMLAKRAWLLNLSRTEFALYLAPLLIGSNMALWVEAWRQKNQEKLLCWIAALGEFEALLCLARHHYENPEWIFPTLCAEAPIRFEAESLGHPLIEAGTRVSCDLSLGGSVPQLIVVSGSNMSGKSTLLRAVGVNAALALAGAPVCASRMTISPLHIAASCSIHDSLRDGRSRFQAEVERIKSVLDEARTHGTLFLLDEMLGGTNSQDRLFGARAVAGQLISFSAIGLITTHDLALTELATVNAGSVGNVHFEEHYSDGQMHFDYLLRSGVLTRTNGRNVMLALGLLPQDES